MNDDVIRAFEASWRANQEAYGWLREREAEAMRETESVYLPEPSVTPGHWHCPRCSAAARPDEPRCVACHIPFVWSKSMIESEAGRVSAGTAGGRDYVEIGGVRFWREGQDPPSSAAAERVAAAFRDMVLELAKAQFSDLLIKSGLGDEMAEAWLDKIDRDAREAAE